MCMATAPGSMIPWATVCAPRYVRLTMAAKIDASRRFVPEPRMIARPIIQG